MFQQTSETRKILWICSLACKKSKDIQPIQLAHVESIIMMTYSGSKGK